MQSLKVETWSLTQLRNPGRTLRKTNVAVERMMQSIVTYGFKIPLLVTSTGEVIDGQLRMKAAKRLGWTALPVIVCDGWSEEMIRGFRLMVNQSAHNVEWDGQAIAAELRDLQGLDFDLQKTGFDDSSIADLLCNGLADEAEETLCTETKQCPTCLRLLPVRKEVR